MRIEKIIHKGKVIIFFDYKGLHTENLLAQIKENTKYLNTLPYNNVLTLSDYTDVYGDKVATEYLRSDEVKKAAAKTKRKAIVGLSMLKVVFLNAYNRFTGKEVRAFDDMEKAKDYLVSD